MNSDLSQPAPAPANLPSASTRTSNLKSRWKRAPSGSAVSQRAATPSVCGEITDIGSARESLSGQHVKGYERSDAPPPRPAAIPVARPTAAAVVTPPPARVESSTEIRWSEPPQYDAPTRPARVEAAPVRQNPPPPAPRVEAAPMQRSSREIHSASPRSRDGSAEPRREPPAPRAREISSEPRRESPAPNRPPSSRPPQDGRGERDHYVALKPDPANDAAPRRLRTEASQPVPVQEYTPSAFGRAPDKSIPVKRERASSRRESESKSTESKRVKPDAVIPARVSSDDDEEPKAKSRGIFGFIKRIFTGDPVKVKEREPAARDREDDSRDERRSGRDHGRDEEGGRRRRHRGGQGRHSHGENRGEHRGERRGDRRPEPR